MASLILSGVPNPPQPGQSRQPYNTAPIPLGGMLDQWSTLQLTNFTVNMYGSGTVELLGPSSLVNSTLEMQGPNGNLLNENLMVLQNSQLDLGSLAGRGMILATGSTITVTSSTPIKDTYQPPGLTRQQSSDLASAQPQLVSLKSSTLNIEGAYTGPVVMDSTSTVIINTDSGLNVGAKNFGIYATGPQLGTVTIDSNAPAHITGIMQVDANLNINGKSPVNIDGGRLILGGFSTGNTIAITSGTLEFAQTPGFLQSPETASDGFNSKLAFTGKTGAVQFDGTAQIGPLIIGIMPNMSEVAVFNQGHPLANIQLSPSASPYSASEFSVHGNTLFFHHS